MTYELFISHSRKDNVPRPLPANPPSAISNPPSKGWVTALRDEILARHFRVTGAPLRSHPFYDLDDIKGMDDWRHKILKGLQQSKILLVCLSPDYFKSDNCLWEWEEFHRHKASRLVGHESVAPVYFIEAPGSDEQVNAAFAAFVERGHYKETELEKFIPRWREWHAAVRRFNHYDFRPWFEAGAAALAEEAVRRKLDELAGNLTDRLARTRRAADAPGNLREYNPHFVGREKQLIELHEALIRDGAVGVITAVNGFGGQGKTEFAVTYAHTRADSYPGGLWVLPAEGRAELLPLFGELAGDARLGIPPSAGTDETAAQRGLRVLARMKELATAAEERDPDGGAATLVILDNVSEPRLLSKTERATLNLPSLGWLRLVATTRLGSDSFPIGHGPLQFLEITSLDEDDAVDLIRNHQPPLDADGLVRDFPPATRDTDAAAAREIARELGGFTLAVESVAIYLGLHPDIRPAAYLARLRTEGLTGVDALPADAGVAAQMQHREKQLRLVLDQTLARLTPAERTALDYAALLPPDSIPWPWLRELVAQEHPEMRDPDAERQRMLREFQYENPQMAALLAALTEKPELLDLLKAQMPADAPEEHRQAIAQLERLAAPPAAHAGYHDPWPALRRRLEGLRLLTPGDHIEIARLHRMVAAHVRARLEAPAQAAATPLGAGRTPAGSEGQRPGPMPAQGNALGSPVPDAPSPEGAAQNPDATVVPPLQGLAAPGAPVPGALPQAGMARPVGAERLRRLRDKVEDFALALQHDIEHAPEKHLWQVAPLQDAVRHWRDGEQDTALGHIAGVVGDIEATLGRLDVAFHFLALANDVLERLLAANPESAQAARDVSVSLIKLADFLAERGQPGDADKALGHYQRSLEVAERLLAANPESAQAARDVSVSLERLGDFLARRGQPGDADKALGHYQRSLEVAERLLAANPESAQAARDVMVSLERMAAFEGGRAGGETKALEFQTRALGIAIKLHEGNPQSVYYGRTAAVSFFLTFQRAQAAGQEELAKQCLAGCFSVLDSLVQAGAELDPPMRQLHAQLAPLFRDGQ